LVLVEIRYQYSKKYCQYCQYQYNIAILTMLEETKPNAIKANDAIAKMAKNTQKANLNLMET